MTVPAYVLDQLFNSLFIFASFAAGAVEVNEQGELIQNEELAEFAQEYSWDMGQKILQEWEDLDGGQILIRVEGQ